MITTQPHTIKRQDLSGIHSHSRPCEGYIIFSVFQHIKMDTCHFEAVKFILEEENIPFKVLEGMYKHKWELSFIVPFEHEELVQAICKKYNQECYLILKQHKHGMYKAFFQYTQSLSDVPVQVGYVMSIPEELVDDAKGWSYCPVMDTYWTITDTDDLLTYGGLAPHRRRSEDTTEFKSYFGFGEIEKEFD